ncbi:MAG: hypothetical protein LBD92_00040 [Oscillospiraceae bacterium]|nr:hypothetical protein [Oscillospiraceae bacterium]
MKRKLISILLALCVTAGVVVSLGAAAAQDNVAGEPANAVDQEDIAAPDWEDAVATEADAAEDEEAATPTSVPAEYPVELSNGNITYDDVSNFTVYPSDPPTIAYIVPATEPASRPADASYESPDLSNAIHDTILRGNNVPTQTTTLPHTASGTISNYSYTNYKFKPRSTGEINTSFTGTISSGTATVEINLYDCNSGQVVASYSLGSGSGWTNNVRLWYNLDTSHYYCFRVNKSTPSNSLTFTLVCS